MAAALEAAACIAIAGIIYYGAKAAVKAIEKNSKKQKYYYKAYIYKNNVFINISNTISRVSASNRLKAGSDTYTYTASLAKQIVNDAGGPCSAKDISNNKGKLNFYHYHIGTIKKHTSAHSFFGIGVMK